MLGLMQIRALLTVRQHMTVLMLHHLGRVMAQHIITLISWNFRALLLQHTEPPTVYHKFAKYRMIAHVGALLLEGSFRRPCPVVRANGSQIICTRRLPTSKMNSKKMTRLLLAHLMMLMAGRWHQSMAQASSSRARMSESPTEISRTIMKPHPSEILGNLETATVPQHRPPPPLSLSSHVWHALIRLSRVNSAVFDRAGDARD